MKDFLSKTWGQVTVGIGALMLIAGGIAAAKDVAPYLPASRSYVLAGLKDALAPIERRLLSTEIDTNEGKQIDLQGQRLQFESLKAKATTDAERAAVQDQINAIDKRLGDLEAARQRALCDLLTLAGASKC